MHGYLSNNLNEKASHHPQSTPTEEAYESCCCQ